MQKLLKMAIEIVDLPINSMGIFHSYVSLPQGIAHLRSEGYHVVIKPSSLKHFPASSATGRFDDLSRSGTARS